MHWTHHGTKADDRGGEANHVDDVVGLPLLPRRGGVALHGLRNLTDLATAG